MSLQREKAKLRPGAVPRLFEGLPVYLSKPKPRSQSAAWAQTIPMVLPLNSGNPTFLDQEAHQTIGRAQRLHTYWQWAEAFHLVGVFDEMSVQKSVPVRESDMPLLGKVDFSEHMRPAYREKDGDHVLVFLFRPFLGGWSQTVGSFCAPGATPGSIVAKLLLQCIVHLSNADVVVDAITCDNSTSNQSALRSLANGEKQADIARRMGLSKQTVNSILKNKDVAEKCDSGEIQEKRFRMRKAAHPDVESALLMWLRRKRETKIDVKFPVEVPAVWAQLKSDVIHNCFRQAGFCRANDAPSTAPQDPCVPSVWPQIQEAFGAEDFADFVSFDDGIVDSEQLTDDEIAALVKNSSDPLLEDDSSEETEAPVKLSSSQAMDYIEALKGYFLQQQGDCSAEVLQLTEMQHKLPQSQEVFHCHYSALLEYEEEQAGLHTVPKPTKAHIFPNAFQKMSVRLAVQVNALAVLFDVLLEPPDSIQGASASS
ncbi:hypothetical protein HPB49_025732 [Dermacentor silvarum]|nr:hypothetical protein HPB49_025732 [Dermacentor silvarum]